MFKKDLFIYRNDKINILGKNTTKVPQARAMKGSLLSCSNVMSWMQVVGANLDQIGMKPL